MPSLHLHIETDPALERELAARTVEETAPNEIARRDLLRYYDLLERTRLTLNFNENEYLLIMEALKGTLFNADVAGMIWAEVEDGIRMDHLDSKWGVDADGLIRRLRTLSLIQNLALADVAERFWSLQEEDLPKRLRLLGVLH